MDEKYIPLDSVLEAIAVQYCACSYETEWTLGKLTGDVKKIPVADVAPVHHAYRHLHRNDFGAYLTCGQCNGMLPEYGNFCQWCGAMLDEGMRQC